MERREKLLIIKGEAGFAIPIVLGVGLIMMLIATIMILRSQGDRTLANAQSSTNQSLTVAEAGVARVQAFLNNNRYFATKNFPWKGYVTDPNELGCPNSPTHDLYTKSQALEAEQNVATNSKFKIISYQVNDTTNPTDGKLVVEGKTFLDADEVRSLSRLQVNIPIRREPQTSFSSQPPGIWANNYDAGNNQFVVKTAIDSGCTSSIDDSKFLAFPTSPPSPVKIIKGNPAVKLPKPLTKPTTDCPATLATAPTTPCVIDLGSPLTDNEVFPRTSDLTNYPDGTSTSGEYIYFIPRGLTAPNNGKSINLADGKQVIIRPGKKVTFYLEGNLEMTAGSFLGHDCYDEKPTIPPAAPSSPNGLYDNSNDGDANQGYQTDGYTPIDTGDVVSGCKSTNFKILGGEQTQKIVIGGNKTSPKGVLYAFILAPNAVDSGLQTGSNTIIKGSVWVKEWKPTSPSSGVVLVEGTDADWNDLPEAVKPYNIAPYTAWQRQEIP